MTKYRKPTQKEELRAFKGLLHELHMHRAITLNHEKVVAILDRMFSWTSAHGDGNGEITEVLQQERVTRAFWEQIHYPGLAYEGLKKPRPKVSKEEAARRREERERDNSGAGSWS